VMIPESVDFVEAIAQRKLFAVQTEGSRVQDNSGAGRRTGRPAGRRFPGNRHRSGGRVDGENG